MQIQSRVICHPHDRVSCVPSCGFTGHSCHSGDLSWPQEVVQLLPFCLYSSQQEGRKDKGYPLFFKSHYCSSHLFLPLTFHWLKCMTTPTSREAAKSKEDQKMEAKRPIADSFLHSYSRWLYEASEAYPKNLSHRFNVKNPCSHGKIPTVQMLGLRIIKNELVGSVPILESPDKQKLYGNSYGTFKDNSCLFSDFYSILYGKNSASLKYLFHLFLIQCRIPSNIYLPPNLLSYLLMFAFLFPLSYLSLL